MQRKTAVRYLAAIACAGSLTPASVLAQGAEEFESLDPDSPVTGTRVVPGFGYRAAAEIDDTGGAEFSETAFSVRGGPSFTLGEDIKLAAFGSYRYSHYNFTDVAADPFENIHTFRLAPIFSYHFSPPVTSFLLNGVMRETPKLTSGAVILISRVAEFW